LVELGCLLQVRDFKRHHEAVILLPRDKIGFSPANPTRDLKFFYFFSRGLEKRASDSVRLTARQEKPREFGFFPIMG
jgi:hypothetical protein